MQSSCFRCKRVTLQKLFTRGYNGVFNVIKLHPQISDIQKWGQSSSKPANQWLLRVFVCLVFTTLPKNRELPCIYILQDAEEAGYFTMI